MASMDPRYSGWTGKFVLASITAVAAIVLLVWAVSGFGLGGLSTHGLIAITLGIVFSVALAVGLMALVFYSNRSGRDQ